MRQFIERHTFWAIVILVAAALFLWLIVAAWPEWVEGVDLQPGLWDEDADTEDEEDSEEETDD